MSKTVSDYLAEICEKPSVPGVFAFRGQKDSRWPLRSAAARRILKHYQVEAENEVPSFPGIYVDYHRNVLIGPARTHGFGLDNGRTLSDLEILATLQHFGAATGLLDFTQSPLIALWFACQNEKVDGKVFSINTIDPSAFIKISHQMVTEDDVSKILSPDADSGSSLPWIWEPIAAGDAGPRVLLQHSLFVIGRPFIAKDVTRKITIHREDKGRLQEELENVYAVREESLFKDVYGFASFNRASYPIPHLENPEWYFLLGSRKFQEGDFQGAVDNYDQALRLKPELAEAYYNRGVAKDALGRYDEAITDYDQALCHQPDFVPAYANRGSAKNRLGYHQEAIADYNQALHRRPDDALVYVNRGSAKGGLGRYDEAIADYSQALHLKLEGAEVYNNRGNAKSALGRYEEAIADYNQAVYLKPKDALAYFNRGNARGALGRYEESIADYDEAIRLKLDHALAYNNRGAAKSRLGRYEEAIADYSQSLRLRPDHALAYSNRGEAKAVLGRTAEARSDFEAALALAREAGEVSHVADVERRIQELDDTEQE